MILPVQDGEVARIEIAMGEDRSLSISGNVGDKRLAEAMLESALESVKAQVRSRTGGLVVASAGDITNHPEFPLTAAGDRR